jgi:hypothetical protein
MKTFIQIISILCLISCNRTSHVNETDEKLIGTYKKGSDNFREVLNLEDNYLLTSESSSRIFGDEIFKENGNWKVNNDTLIIERIRHDVLKESGFPSKQKFLIKGDKFFELSKNYKGELFETAFFFEKQ